MLIGSFSGIAYTDFMLRLTPVAIVGLFVNWGILAWIGRKTPGPSADNAGETLVVEESGVVDLPAGSGEYRLAIRRPPHRRPLLKPVIVMVAVLAGFLAGVPPALMAALGAAVLLITRARDPREVYDDVDWGLLVFFVGLFLIVRGAENAGVITAIMNMFSFLNLQNVASFSLVTVFLSNVVSNVPAVMLLKSAATEFADAQTGWLMLAMASTLAGNLTITGSVANIIVVERAAPQVRIGFGEYFRVGAPVTAITVLLGTFWLMM
jgi:Na+/H+ antiporter NhaD/arsenite permease-like protein